MFDTWSQDGSGSKKECCEVTTTIQVLNQVRSWRGEDVRFPSEWIVDDAGEDHNDPPEAAGVV